MAVATAPQQLNSPVSRNRPLVDIQRVCVVIQDALIRTGHRELRLLDLECVGEAITITGCVPTFYLKQLVQSIALAAPGVGRVDNQLHVR